MVSSSSSSFLMSSRHYPRAIAMLIGTIVGVGVFGVPYVMAQAGVAIGFVHFGVLTVAVLLVHLAFGEVALRTTAHHRLVGYADLYLGKTGKWIAGVTGILGMYGALLAYIIVGGDFLHALLGGIIGGTPWHYSLAMAILGGLVIARGLRLVEELEFILTAFLFLAVALIAIVGIQRVDPIHWASVDLRQWFLPYGVVLFSLGGVSAIAEIRDTLRGRERLLPRAIAWGTLIASLLTVLFAIVVVGVSGPGTTEAAIAGLEPQLGRSIVLLGAFLGVLTIVTSFLMLGLYGNDVFRYDFRIPKVPALLLAVGVPVLIFLFGAPGFITTIMVTGAIFGGLDGILVMLIALRARRMGDRQPEYHLRMPAFVYWLIALLFAVGMGVTIESLFFPSLS